MHNINNNISVNAMSLSMYIFFRIKNPEYEVETT